MRIASVGGGPAGLYFAILMKRAFPEAEIDVFERERSGETFGWGVVFSDETLEGFLDADPESAQTIRERFVHWTDIETYFRGHTTVSTGHGFSGFARRELLIILQARAAELGVNTIFETNIEDVTPLMKEYDLVLGADGVNSGVRQQLEAHFQPSIDWRQCRFSWLGTDLPLTAFTFIFEETEFGLFQVHAYPFGGGLSTFIVECQDDVWHRAGLDDATEEETVAFCEKVFGKYLDGHRLLNNKSIWRRFPTIHCERWHHENVVLLGDAVHTAHFSIGSGTKLAMEGAIALVDAFVEHGTDDVPKVLAAYEEERRIDVLKTQKAAQTSLEWFENSARYLEQDPVRFAFNLMSRSKRITWDNLELRDPQLVAKTREVFADEEAGGARQSDGLPPVPAFTPFSNHGLTLNNRIVVSPMCMYSAHDGLVSDWHFVHYGSRAMGGAGLIITEETNVAEEGRITPGCAGLWTDEQADAWKRIVDFVHTNTKTHIGVQLGHAGRKASCTRPWDGDRPLTADEGAWETLGPSALPFDEGWHTPKALDRADMDRLVQAFIDATKRAEYAGFDLVELHMAHGYLLSSFLSPLSNQREDEYGGSLSNRLRFPLEVLDAVREAWPEDKPVWVRISAVDWHPDGLDSDDAVTIAGALQAHGCDVLDVSSAGNSPASEPVYGRMYQVPFAERIKYETGLPVCCVGALFGADHVNTVLASGRADLCAMARPHLRSPYLTLDASLDYDAVDQWWPEQYLLGRSKPKTR